MFTPSCEVSTAPHHWRFEPDSSSVFISIDYFPEDIGKELLDQTISEFSEFAGIPSAAKVGKSLFFRRMLLFLAPWTNSAMIPRRNHSHGRTALLRIKDHLSFVRID
jgi:hypothetical protein